MSEEETEASVILQPAPPKGWKLWLEFAQVIAALVVAAGVALPFALHRPESAWPPEHWVIGAALVAAGFLAGWMSYLGIPPAERPVLSDVYEISTNRLRTLKTIGTPRDVREAMDSLQSSEKAWTGTEAELRATLYQKIGVKRGAAYLPVVLPYLAVYEERRRKDDAGFGDRDIMH